MLDAEELYKKLFTKVHDQACERKEFTYIDPKTGLMVFTKLYHLDRGHCCSSGCRHCPYKTESSKERS